MQGQIKFRNPEAISKNFALIGLEGAFSEYLQSAERQKHITDICPDAEQYIWDADVENFFQI